VVEAVQKRLDKNPHAMRQRRETVEHPFGTVKMRMGAAHFLTKRLPKGGHRDGPARARLQPHEGHEHHGNPAAGRGDERTALRAKPFPGLFGGERPGKGPSTMGIPALWAWKFLHDQDPEPT